MNYDIYKERNFRIFIKEVEKVTYEFSKLFKIDKKTTLSLAFVTASTIEKMNLQYRKKNKSTDVLSFRAKFDNQKNKDFFRQEDLLGEIVICYDVARDQAKEQKKPIKQIVNKLLVHGLVHLMGYDHVLDKDWVKMKKVEESLLKKIYND